MNETIFPAGTPKNVVEGRSHFVDKYLLMKVLIDFGTNARQASIYVFWDRGKKHAQNKIGEWIKWRYPAMNEDLKAVVDYIDPNDKYDWRDFCFTDYQSSEYKQMLYVYHSFGTRKYIQAKDAEFRKKHKREVNQQLSLF